MKGIKRFRQAIKNQLDLGNGDFRLTYHDAEEIAAEIEDELLGICSSDERETGRYACAYGVPAPKDADGKVIPLSTEKLYTDKGETIIVGCIHFNGYSWSIENMDDGKLYWVGALHLAQHDSWEKLEEDIQKVAKTYGTCAYYDKVGKTCDGCPASDIPDLCSTIMLRDILRRAKALTGSGED
jgi:hypothetical protein